MYTLIVVWAILEVARCIVNSIRVCSEAGIGEAALIVRQKAENLCWPAV